MYIGGESPALSKCTLFEDPASALTNFNAASHGWSMITNFPGAHQTFILYAYIYTIRTGNLTAIMANAAVDVCGSPLFWSYKINCFFFFNRGTITNDLLYNKVLSHFVYSREQRVVVLVVGKYSESAQL